MNRLTGLSCFVCVWVASSAFAQTISYTDPVVTVPDSGVTSPPVVKWVQKPDYPKQMTHSAEIGYVLSEESVDESGQGLADWVFGNGAAFQSSMELGKSHWTMKPALVGHKAVNTQAYFAVLFNPPSHPGVGYDASPTLTRVTTLYVPGKTGAADHFIIPVTLAIDVTGRVTSATTPATDSSAVRDALLHQLVPDWQFTPATLAGKPVACSLSMSVVVQIHFTARGKTTTPRILSQEYPAYPYLMRLHGIEGSVLVDFVVSKTGSVVNAYALKSTAPWLVTPAVTAVQHWRFKPATVDGAPVNTHMQVPIAFSMGGGGANAFSTRAAHSAKGEFPAEVTNIVRPVYPFDLVMADKTGSARVRALVSADGEPLQVEVLSADFPSLGTALSAAAWCYTFNPAYKDGKPVSSWVNIAQDFSFAEFLADDVTKARAAERRKDNTSIRRAKELDAPLRPVSQRPVVPPGAVKETRTVVVEFLVDEEGRVQLARVKEGEQDVMAYAAVQAVSSWLFDPPTINGRPVMVRGEVPLVFKASAETEAAPIAPASR